jgi:cellulose synthase/poly-beta-1,6-N-acetylglucosamine synthase-like glycosyltransferase
VSVDTSPTKNKPRQLNAALRECSHEYVAVFDAESLTHPELFVHADAMLSSTGCDVLQCGVQLVNHRTAWFSLRNCLEYFFWFRSRLHLHAHHGFIPLGGNTVFIRRSMLDELGGWDERALTEDCELGVRLSSHGVSVAVTYDPRLVTREETPETVQALVRQRSRWNQGFLQVLAKGEWRRLPTRRQRLLARYTLLQPFFQALTFAALVVAIVATLTVKLPLAIAMLTFLPLVPTVAMVLFECAVLREFGRDLDLPIDARDYARLVLSTLPYVTVLGYAALRALVREWGGRDDWEKTPHAGHHIATVPVAVEVTSA